VGVNERESHAVYELRINEPVPICGGQTVHCQCPKPLVCYVRARSGLPPVVLSGLAIDDLASNPPLRNAPIERCSFNARECGGDDCNEASGPQPTTGTRFDRPPSPLIP
jgi:hypothetical protein